MILNKNDVKVWKNRNHESLRKQHVKYTIYIYWYMYILYEQYTYMYTSYNVHKWLTT